MMEAILTVVVIVVFLEVILILSRQDVKRKRKAYLHNKFGIVPEEAADNWNENRRNYYDLFAQADDVDDITWNDLSMNEIFVRVNNCDTSVGEEVLYWRLRKCGMSEADRDAFERSAAAFDRDEDLRVAAEEQLGNIGKTASSYYIPSYMDAIEEYSMKHGWIYRGLQIIFIAALILFLIFRTDVFGILLAVVSAVNVILYMILKMRFEIELGLSGPAVSLLHTAAKLAGIKEIRELYPELNAKITVFGGLQRKAKLLLGQKATADSGDLLGIILDYILGITLWQITTYNTVMSRLSRHSEDYLAIYQIVGEIDLAINTASFRRSLPLYCLPEETSERYLYMDDIYHPLISNPVGNTLELSRGCLITGSNASGKSTFIKAVAVNAILGQAINTCAAARMVMPPVRVMTSMAVKDDLVAGESYFIREIRYLKRILDGLTEDKVTLCAIDEILRGTNTGERIRASRAILEYLADRNCISMVASHDKELTELLAKDYDNYHFSEEIGENDITFSYKIMKGPATSQNAVKLLELAGFPGEIIAEASCLYS